jgi:hypothetical protein
MKAQEYRCHPECTQAERCRVRRIIVQEQIVPVLFFQMFHDILTTTENWCSTPEIIWQILGKMHHCLNRCGAFH